MGSGTRDEMTLNIIYTEWNDKRPRGWEPWTANGSVAYSRMYVYDGVVFLMLSNGHDTNYTVFQMILE